MTITIEEVATKVVVPLVAAFAGAFTAQHFADRNRRREDLLKEVRSTNAAISLACAVCQGGMRLKKQYVQELKADFEASKAAFIEGQRRHETGQARPGEVIEVRFTLCTIQPPKLDAAALRAHVLERVNVAGRALQAAVEVDDCATALAEVMAERNDQVRELRAEQRKLVAEGKDAIATAPRYFGFRTANGLDERYSSLVEVLHESTDNVIFFSHQLCCDLQEHGRRLTERFPRRFVFLRDKRVPHIQTMDFTRPIADGLIPSSQRFIDWLAAFSTYPERPTLWENIRHPIASWRRTRSTP